MKQVPLGKSGLTVSRLAFGCMSLGDIAESTRTLHAAIDQGFTYFDTADLYDKGQNETLVGTALKEKRNSVQIGTKVGNVWSPAGNGWNWAPTKKHLLSAIDESLTRLQTDYIDLYQLHGGTIEDPIDEIIEAFERLVEAGKIRTYGISSIRPNVIREYTSRSNIASVMMQYSLLDRRPEESMIQHLRNQEISILARGVLAKGLLIHKPVKAYLNHSEKEVEEIQSWIAETKNPLATNLQFAMRQDHVIPTLGIRTESQLDQVVEALKHPPVPELEELAKKVPVLQYEQHR